jgi:hypothetical protein
LTNVDEAKVKKTRVRKPKDPKVEIVKDADSSKVGEIKKEEQILKEE